eukprot:3368434-Pleurochrysis_carterae.AAC.1
MAIALAAGRDISISLKTTRRTYKSALREKGRDRRPPELQGGDNMASVPPNLHSVEVDSQSSSESRNEGTQRTLRSIRLCCRAC